MYANKNNEYFTKKEALETLREVVSEYDSYYCDLYYFVLAENT